MITIDEETLRELGKVREAEVVESLIEVSGLVLVPLEVRFDWVGVLPGEAWGSFE